GPPRLRLALPRVRLSGPDRADSARPALDAFGRGVGARPGLCARSPRLSADRAPPRLRRLPRQDLPQAAPSPSFLLRSLLGLRRPAGLRNALALLISFTKIVVRRSRVPGFPGGPCRRASRGRPGRASGP